MFLATPSSRNLVASSKVFLQQLRAALTTAWAPVLVPGGAWEELLAEPAAPEPAGAEALGPWAASWCMTAFSGLGFTVCCASTIWM
eukprot:9040801-Lingulodinium_polyedra.AAC.1